MAFIWLFLTVVRPREPEVSAGTLLMRYGLGLRAIAWVIALGIPMLLVWVMGSVPLRPPNGVWIVGGGMVAAGVVGGLLLIETARVRIAVNSEGVRASGPWRKERMIEWGRVAEVSFSTLNRWFVVTSITGETIRVSVFLRGIRDFVRAVQERVPQDKRVHAERGFRML